MRVITHRAGFGFRVVFKSVMPGLACRPLQEGVDAASVKQYLRRVEKLRCSKSCVHTVHPDTQSVQDAAA